jgi:hypothetical protein
MTTSRRRKYKKEEKRKRQGEGLLEIDELCISI